MLTLDQVQRVVAEVAQRFNDTSHDDKVTKISLFGSYAAERATGSSDVDLLVEFDSQFASIFSLGHLLIDLEQALGVPVDIVPSPLPKESFITLGTTVQLYTAK